MLFNNFIRNYIKFVVGSSFTGGILNNVENIGNLNIEENGIIDNCYDIIDITLEGMSVGLIFGLTSPISLPIMAISTLNKIIRE